MAFKMNADATIQKSVLKLEGAKKKDGKSLKEHRLT